MLSPRLDALYTDTMFPDEFDEIIASKNVEPGGAVAVLPIGSVEWFGPQMLLGGDGYNAMAIADMTASKLGGVLFPLIPLSFVGGLTHFAGTIEVKPCNMADYMGEVCLEIGRQGFKRLILVNCHGGGHQMVYSVARQVYKKTELTVIPMFQSSFFTSWPEIKDIFTKHNEKNDVTMYTNQLAAALQHLGYDDLLDKLKETNKACLKEFGEALGDIDNWNVPSYNAVSRMGFVGRDDPFNAKFNADIYSEAAREMMEFIAEKLAFVANENV